jgi:integrase
MASVSKRADGSRRVYFVDANGRRLSIQLGGKQARFADQLARYVGNIVAAQVANHSIDAETARWVCGLPDMMHSKLARLSLVPEREQSSGATKSATGLEAFLHAYRDGLGAPKPNTVRNLNQTIKRLVRQFGATKPVASFLPSDADAFVERMKGDELAPATISRELKRAKQFFRAAVRQRIITANPFEDLKAGPQTNESRQHFIDRETTAKVLAACPDAEWRLIFALCRFGGLRCPSEVLSLTWAAVDWAGGRITIASPKTERHPGGGKRVLPLFPELRPYLEAAFEAAPDGATFVITQYRQANVNLRTQLGRILERASVSPWPKLFANLRATRETELNEQYPAHVVCKWLGNSLEVAHRHYLQVTDEHYRRAAGGPDSAPEKVTQNVTQQATARRDPDSHQTRQPREKRISLGAERYSGTPTGKRTTAVSPVETGISAGSHANCHALSADQLEQLAAALVALAAVPMSDADRAATAQAIAKRLGG